MKHSRGKASRLAEASSTPLVKINQYRPCLFKLGRTQGAMPLNATGLKNAPFQLSQLLAMRLRDAGQILVPSRRQF
jgi:hypothetical protein